MLLFKHECFCGKKTVSLVGLGQCKTHTGEQHLKPIPGVSVLKNLEPIAKPVLLNFESRSGTVYLLGEGRRN